MAELSSGHFLKQALRLCRHQIGACTNSRAAFSVGSSGRTPVYRWNCSIDWMIVMSKPVTYAFLRVTAVSMSWVCTGFATESITISASLTCFSENGQLCVSGNIPTGDALINTSNVPSVESQGTIDSHISRPTCRRFSRCARRC